MNCTKCGNPLNDGAKFCRACGQNQAMPVDQAPPVTQVPPAQTPPPVPPQASGQAKPGFDFNALGEQGKVLASQGKAQGQVLANQGKAKVEELKSAGKLNLVLAGAGGVAAVLVLLCMVLFSSPSGKVSKAFLSTSNQLQKEYKSILKDVPVYDFFKDAQKDNFQVDYVSESWYSTDFYMELDWGKSQLKYEIGEGDYQTTIHISEKYTTIDSKMADLVYGVENKTLGKDVNNCSFLDIQMSNDYSFDPFSLDMDLPSDILDIFIDFSTDLVKSADVEKVDDQTYRINGNRESLDTYEVRVSAQELEKAMESAVASFVKNKSIMNQMTQLYMMDSSGSYRYVTDLKDIEGKIEDELYDLVDDIVDEYSKLRDNYIVVQLYKGQVVRMATSGRDGENLSIMFTNTKNLLEEVVLESYGLVYTYSAVSDGDTLTYKTVDYRDRMNKIEYTYEGRSENVKITTNGNVEYATLDTTTKNVLVVEVENDYEMTVKKNSLSSGWFDQDTNFERILEYTEREVEGIIGSLF